MGDRAQVQIREGRSSVYLYTHWGGDNLGTVVTRALARRQRWNDSEYLARIIFCEMVKGDETGETGFGIGTAEHGDISHPIVVIDVEKQTIALRTPASLRRFYLAYPEHKPKGRGKPITGPLSDFSDVLAYYE